MNQTSYAYRAQTNKTRLLTMLAMRRAGQAKTIAYRSLKKQAMQEYRQLTDERCQQIVNADRIN